MDVSYHNGVADISEKLERSLHLGADEKMEEYRSHMKDGKDAVKQGNMSKALEHFKLADKIFPNEKAKSRVQKIEELLAQQASDSEDEEFVNVNNSGLMIYKEQYDNLYEHQKEGVAFLYSLYRDKRKGGILADDMGLGKTIQVISFLSGMYDAELVKCTLLVMPTSLITNWTKEFAKWTPGMRVKEFHGTSKTQRIKNLEKIQRRGGVIITTFQMLINNWEALASYNGREFKWDYVILDEAHKIKTSSTKTAKSAAAIPAKNRVLLTGTPVQNNLREMWALFDFACQGTLLGTSKTFKTEYENPITRAREKDATPGEKALGFKMSENLMEMIKPYFLRRTKAEVQKGKKATEHLNKDGAEMPTLTRKNDLIVWTYLSPVQEDFYNQFLSLDHIKELLMTTRSPLAELNVLKKLCDHPRLLSTAAIAHLGLDDQHNTELQDDENESAANVIDNVPDETLISESGKLVFLIALLERLREEGHRVLVFAHFRKVLDIIERVLINKGFKVMRLDGTITQLAEREKRISRFQKDKRYSVFLLTTQVGGVGITLTAANRVVVFDPSWNPATDAQAVDRAYRIGQTENVVIYRLITCGTVEEKIYRRQVFKDSLIRQTTGDKKNPFRYFSKQELRELFTLQDTRSSSTQLQLQALHSKHRRTDPELDEHIAYLHTMEMFGISDHDLMFSQDVNKEDDPEDDESQQYIEKRVQKASELMKAESELHMQLADSMASSTEPAWLRIQAQNDKEKSNEKKPKKEKPSPSFSRPENLNLSLNGSIDKDASRDLSVKVIDLTQEDSIAEVTEETLAKINGDSPSSGSKEVLSDVELANSPEQGVETSPVMKGTFVVKDNKSVECIQLDSDEDEQLTNGHSHTDLEQSQNQESDMGKKRSDLTPLQNKQLSILQMSETSFKMGTSLKIDSEHESFDGGNFNLQLEDSDVDMFAENGIVTENDIDTEKGTDEQESRLLTELRLEGSFDVDKVMSAKSEGSTAQSANTSRVSVQDLSLDNSFIATKKRRVAVIYDSEDEQSDEEKDNMEDSDRPQFTQMYELDDSFKGIEAASTPKSEHRIFKGRKSIGGNASVASRRSLVISLIEDLEDDNIEDDVLESMNESNSGDTKDDALEDTEDDVSEGMKSGSSEKVKDISSENMEDVSPYEESVLEEEEPSGESLGSEDDEEESEIDSEEWALAASDLESEEKAENTVDESTAEPELNSSERMDQCTVDRAVQLKQENSVTSSENQQEDGSYASLVKRGKQYYSEGKLDDALGFFLKAIDINSGDPEIQLMTIQLYRQLSAKTKN